MERVGVILLSLMLHWSFVAHAGLSYKVTLKQEILETQLPAIQTLTIKVLEEGKKGRATYVENSADPVGVGMYVLTTDGGRSFVSVNPTEKSFQRTVAQESYAALGRALKEAHQTLKYTNPQFEMLANEPGPKIQGFSTRRYKYKTTFKMAVKTPQQVLKGTNSTVEEVWTTSKLGGSAFGAWFRNHEFKTGNAQLDNMIRVERKKIKGFPIKYVRVTTEDDDTGKRNIMRTVAEVSDIKQAPIPEDQFIVPKGFLKK